jgi:hypothetical protein
MLLRGGGMIVQGVSAFKLIFAPGAGPIPLLDSYQVREKMEFNT